MVREGLLQNSSIVLQRTVEHCFFPETHRGSAYLTNFFVSPREPLRYIDELNALLDSLLPHMKANQREKFKAFGWHEGNYLKLHCGSLYFLEYIGYMVSYKEAHFEVDVKELPACFREAEAKKLKLEKKPLRSRTHVYLAPDEQTAVSLSRYEYPGREQAVSLVDLKNRGYEIAIE